MIYALKERIGDPSLFCGRQKQMKLLMNWVETIPREIAHSRALLGRRKSGKTAIMQRLFNILWNQNGVVIPFYFEVKDENQWLLEFADNYYRTFLSQYLSFKTRTVLAHDNLPWKFAKLVNMAREIGDENALEDIQFFQEDYEAKRVGPAKSWAFGAPARFTGPENIFVLVMIDEMQFMTKYIFHDQAHQVSGQTLPGAFHDLVELKVAPMLVSGSYVGWMMQMMQDIFKGGRLRHTKIPSQLAVEEGLEAVYRYAEHNHKEVSDEAAFFINLLTQSDPFYIASLFRSDWEEQDFTSVEGAISTLAYEIRNPEGEIFGTWSEYIDSTIRAVNDYYAKKILLFLSKKRHEDCTRVEISNHLGGKLSDRKLESRLRALKYGDLITQGNNRFRYSGIEDDILDLIFRDLYQEEIEQDKPDIEHELVLKVKALEKDKKYLQGTLNEYKGRMLELMVYRELNQCRKKCQPVTHFRQRFRPIPNAQQADQMEELLTACSANCFDRIWMNHFIQLPGMTAVEVDVLAVGEDVDHCWALVFETKNRDEKHLPTLAEAQVFVANLERIKQWLGQTQNQAIRFICPVYLSAEGFDSTVETWLHEQGVLTTDMAHWKP